VDVLHVLKRQRLSSRPSPVEFAIAIVVAVLSLGFLAAALVPAASDLPTAVFFIVGGLFGLAISVVPIAASSWRDRIDAELRRTGVRSAGIIVQVTPAKLGRGVSIVRYEYLAPDGLRRFGEAYEWTELVKLASGDRGDVLALRDRPDISMWIGDARVA